jgi:hypothetical protein
MKQQQRPASRASMHHKLLLSNESHRKWLGKVMHAIMHLNVV